MFPLLGSLADECGPGFQRKLDEEEAGIWADRAGPTWCLPNLLRHERVMVLAGQGQVDQ